MLISVSGNSFDGVSQVTAMLAADASKNAREYLLYNMYYKVVHTTIRLSINGVEKRTENDVL